MVMAVPLLVFEASFVHESVGCPTDSCFLPLILDVQNITINIRERRRGSLTYDFLKALYEDIMSMIKGLVVKRQDLALNNETLETARAFAEYLACVNGTRYFHTFASYELSVCEAVAADEYTAVQWHNNATTIPEEYRDRVVELQAQYVLDTYEEKNNYYRMLMGLPSYDSTNWIYPRDDDGNYLVVDSDGNGVPIQNYTSEQVSWLEVSGRLATLRSQYDGDEYDYLDHLGLDSIGFLEARTAKPFEILRLGSCSNPRAVESFTREYVLARRYTLANIYNSDQVTTKTLYDPIVGIIMLTLAVRNTLVPDEKSYLNYEEVLDAILESYGMLRYFQRFPFTYKQRLVINLDRLLASKGTDGVLVDVCKLFNDEDLIANRYYLMKTQTQEADGSIVQTGDPDRDYTLTFIKAPISDHDINTTEENRIPYDTITRSDYLWQIDHYSDEWSTEVTPEYKAMVESEFNLLMTKYVDVEAAYDLTSLVFETCCFLNLLLYARENLSKVAVINVYATGGRSSLFTMINFLLAAMAKRANFDGNIVYDPSSIAEVWRFNYGDIADDLQAIVDKYELQIDVDDDQTLVDEFDPVELSPVGGNVDTVKVLNAYIQNRELYRAIVKEMNETSDWRRYNALLQARDVLFTSAMERATFTKMDGTTASTYYEMLEDLDPRLARKVRVTGGTPEERETATRMADSGTPDVLDNYNDELNSLIIYILERLEDLFNSDELEYLFLNSPTIYGSLISKYIVRAINVFKASSVQLHNINIYFKLGESDPVRVLDDQHSDTTKYIHDGIHVKDEVGTHTTIYLDDYIHVGDKIYTNL